MNYLKQTLKSRLKKIQKFQMHPILSVIHTHSKYHAKKGEDMKAYKNRYY